MQQAAPPIAALLGWLEWEGLVEVEAQDQREREELEVQFDDLFPC